MKINPNYLGRLFTEDELSMEEHQLASETTQVCEKRREN